MIVQNVIGALMYRNGNVQGQRGVQSADKSIVTVPILGFLYTHKGITSNIINSIMSVTNF